MPYLINVWAKKKSGSRQGIKARRTRNEGRVRSLEAMRKEVSKRLKRQDKARIHIEEAEQSGRQSYRSLQYLP